MKFTAEMHAPQRMQATFEKIVITGNGGYDTGYSDGYNEGHAAGHEDGYKEGEAAGYTEGEKHGSAVTSSFYDDRISAELAEVNDVIQEHGDSKAETLEQVSEAVSTTIGAASMKAQTVGYAQGVDDTNAQRDAKDAAYLNDINEVLQDYGSVADDLGSVDETFRESIEVNMGIKYGIGYDNGTKDANAERDVVDASRLDKINAALTENGGTAAETLDNVGEKIPEVHAAGVKSEYDRFWDIVQNKGDSISYYYRFYRWTDELYNPKYPILFSRADRRFSDSAVSTFQYSTITDVKVNLDASDLVNYYGLTATFNNASKLVNARTIKVSEGTLYNGAFHNCTSLEEVRFEGAIGQSGLNFQWSTKLSRASIESIIAALSASASGKSITLSKTAVNAEFTTDEWNALAGTKTNWTISLV